MFTPKELALERGWPGRIDGRPRHPARGADAAVVLHRRRNGARARRVRARRRRPAAAGAPSAERARLHGLRGARRERARLRGREVPPEWYEMPVFYFSNPSAIFGPGDEVPYPDGTEELDYELECAAIIGAGRRDRRLHDHERLVGARPAAGRDARRARAGERARTSRRRSGRSSSRRTSSTARPARWWRA